MRIEKVSDTKVSLTQEVPDKVREYTLGELQELLNKHITARDSWLKEIDRANDNIVIQEAKITEVENLIAQAKELGVIEESKDEIKEITSDGTRAEKDSVL